MEKADVADEGLPDVGEGEPPRRVLPVPVDDEVPVVLVYPGGPRDGAPVEELPEGDPLRVVDVVPREPACERETPLSVSRCEEIELGFCREVRGRET